MSTKLLVTCAAFIFCVGYVAGDFCFTDVDNACSTIPGREIKNCNARYGAFIGDELMTSVQTFVNQNIYRSFQLLLMSSHFGNFEKNRHGFEKLYRKLSDNTWEKAIDLTKFIGTRGGHMNFGLFKDKQMDYDFDCEVHELGSMAQALDIHKELAEDVNNIHSHVVRNKKHDAHIASYFENNFVHEHSDVIRKLSGHTNDLKNFITSQADPSLSLYLFDEYLQKTE